MALAGRLAGLDDGYADWAQAVGVASGPLEATEKEDHIHELDAVVAHLYGLSARQLVHIFETFHEGWDYHPQWVRRACRLAFSQSGHQVQWWRVSVKGAVMTQVEAIQKQAAPDLPPPDFYDPVIEAYKKDVDRTLLRENLKLTAAERSRKFERTMRMVFELRRAGRKRREQSKVEP